jgi:ComF family protein
LHTCIQDKGALTAVYTAVAYVGPIPRAIHQLKYESQFAVATPLSELMATAWQPHWPEMDLIVPIPLHKKREQKRGYNQSALIAQAFGQLCNVPHAAEALYRVRFTTPQVGLNAHERKHNVDDAFWATKIAQNKTVLLIDDVYTTGATMAAAASALLTAGATAVYGYALARALPN